MGVKAGGYANWDGSIEISRDAVAQMHPVLERLAKGEKLRAWEMRGGLGTVVHELGHLNSPARNIAQGVSGEGAYKGPGRVLEEAGADMMSAVALRKFSETPDSLHVFTDAKGGERYAFHGGYREDSETLAKLLEPHVKGKKEAADALEKTFVAMWKDRSHAGMITSTEMVDHFVRHASAVPASGKKALREALLVLK